MLRRIGVPWMQLNIKIPDDVEDVIRLHDKMAG